MSYAERTTVPISKTKQEIERLVEKAGADQFLLGRDGRRNALHFRLHGRLIRFTVDMPNSEEASGRWTQQKLAQEERRLWRALFLTIRAKLESVASGIETFEESFLGQFVTASGETIYDRLGSDLEHTLSTGPMPLLLTGEA